MKGRDVRLLGFAGVLLAGHLVPRFPAPSPVRWRAPARAAEIARASGRPILYVFGAAGVCADPAAAAEINDRFVPVRLARRSARAREVRGWLRLDGDPEMVAVKLDGDGYEAVALHGRPTRARLRAWLVEAAGRPYRIK